MEKRIFCLEGHLIEQNLLANIMAAVKDTECDFRILQFDVGSGKNRPSFLKIALHSENAAALQLVSNRLFCIGMQEENKNEAIFKPAPADRFVPDDFYVATGHQTEVLCGGQWLSVTRPRANTVVIKNSNGLECILLRDVKKDDCVLCGDEAVRISPISGLGAFSNYETERSSNIAAMAVADVLIENRATRKKTIFLAGSVAIRSGGGSALRMLAEAGYMQGLLANNDLALYDLEASLFNTVLGYSTEDGSPIFNARKNTLRTINRINGYGSIGLAVEAGAVRCGLMYELEKQRIPYSLAGAISDLGPLPDTITDMQKAQASYDSILEGADALIMFSSYSHALGAAKLIPSWVKTFLIDINSSVVSRITESVAPQAVGIVSDVGLFLNDLARILNLHED